MHSSRQQFITEESIEKLWSTLRHDVNSIAGEDTQSNDKVFCKGMTLKDGLILE